MDRQNYLAGKNILITGASSGIGLAIANSVAPFGANLFLVSRRKSLLESISKELAIKYNVTVDYYALDVRNKEAVQKYSEYLESKNNKIDILINNAGLSRGKDKLQDGSIEDWEEMIDTNLKGLLYITKAILPGMVSRREGHIVNIGSIAGEGVYVGGNVYNVTKIGVKALTEAMLLDLLNTGVKVSNVSPGAVKTEFSLVRFKGDKNKADKVYENFTPLTADDVANTVVFVINSPKHVNLSHVVILPTAQRSSYMIGEDV